ncbi:class II SORL domain-containing protein [Patescibacteria group bacterium]|nr:class II SORL domain-containing protein [Patescibacteria group bacterium]
MKIQRAKNPKALTGFEQMHLPWISFPEFIKIGEEFDLVVKIGEVSHPMTSEHYIRCIRLYINEEQFECQILKDKKKAQADFKIKLEKDSTITVVTECNFHGAWEAKKKIILYRGNGE